jgi:hypothetical protein
MLTIRTSCLPPFIIPELLKSWCAQRRQRLRALAAYSSLLDYIGRLSTNYVGERRVELDRITLTSAGLPA